MLQSPGQTAMVMSSGKQNNFIQFGKNIDPVCIQNENRTFSISKKILILDLAKFHKVNLTNWIGCSPKNYLHIQLSPPVTNITNHLYIFAEISIKREFLTLIGWLERLIEVIRDSSSIFQT